MRVELSVLTHPVSEISAIFVWTKSAGVVPRSCCLPVLEVWYANSGENVEDVGTLYLANSGC